MSTFRIRGLPSEVCTEVRRNRMSPGYGHPVHCEVAKGTGPCRSCLSPFEVDSDERLLFTYRPDGGAGAPAPVFIHAEECLPYEGTEIPVGLSSFPLFIEGRTDDGRVLRTERAKGRESAAVVESILEDSLIGFVYFRHGEAGCHIARVDRG